MDSKELSAKLQSAIGDLTEQFPGLGVTLFVFDFGSQGGISYISNAERGAMVRALKEWIRNVEGRN